MVILTGLNSALCCKSRAGNTEIGNTDIAENANPDILGLNSALCCKSRASYTEIGNNNIIENANSDI